MSCDITESVHFDTRCHCVEFMNLCLQQNGGTSFENRLWVVFHCRATCFKEKRDIRWERENFHYLVVNWQCNWVVTSWFSRVCLKRSLMLAYPYVRMVFWKRKKKELSLFKFQSNMNKPHSRRCLVRWNAGFGAVAVGFTICTAGPPLFHIHITRYFKEAFAWD